MEHKFNVGDIVIGNVLNDYIVTCRGRRAVVVNVGHPTAKWLVRIKPYGSDSYRGEYDQFKKFWYPNETYWVDETCFDLWVPELCDVSMMSLLQEGA